MGTPATRDEVARLFGRAAFGATKTDLDTWTGRDYDEVVDALFPTPTPVPVPLTDEATRSQLETNQYDLTSAQKWWLERMRSTPFPLVERVTLFWHTHFATGFTGSPDVGEMMKQNQTIRTHALGDFRALLHNLTVDGAMLHWLSGEQNRRNAVNENYARELFELFTMGTTPQTYTETDIRQAAKALTGWYVNATTRLGQFDTNRHDRSVKTIFGRSVGGYPANDAREKTEYQEVCNLALEQPTAAKFVAYKMVCGFAYVPATTDLLTGADPLVEAVAAALRPATTTGKWDITAALKTMFKHPSFRDGDRAAGRVLVRSPIELVVHLGKMLGTSLNNSNNTGWMPLNVLQRMAQTPFRPPNVAGWPQGTEWLSAPTQQGRYNAGDMMAKVWASQGLTTAAVTKLPKSTDLAAWTSFVGLGSLTPLTQQRLTAYLANPGTGDEATKQRSVLILLAASPDWQVM